MKISRHFTTAGRDVFDDIAWSTRTSRISGTDGRVVFEMNDAEVPAGWSQLATDIMVSKYFRKAGVPQLDENGEPLEDADGQPVTGPERSARQVIHRLALCWTTWGREHGYFDTAEDGDAFYDELCHMMLRQMCAPNSPQWFNTGLNAAYGIQGPPQGHWYVDPETGEARQSEDAYTHPQPHACFIQSVDDDLVGDDGIMSLWTREARLFKYGSGTGTNFSSIRGEDEPLAGGGRSSGLMSFLKIGDRAAGAIKSGGTTRRAAKMCCLDLDHPDVEAFVNWKVREEIKVAALVAGMERLADQKASPDDPETLGETAERLGLQLDYDFNGEAYATVSGQNSNNSVRIPNAFFEAVANDADWTLTRRTDGEVAKTLDANALWDAIGYAAWRCADPGVQYDTTINDWHTCPEAGRINASNPCSEYMFLDDTACNLASLNLLTFFDEETATFDAASFEHGVSIWTIVLEISVLMAQFPSRAIAENSFRFRTLGLGYANLGAMLMRAGIPYDSDRGRAIAGCVTAILTGRSYATSAAMAGELGAFPAYAENLSADPAGGGNMLRVIRNHRRAAYGIPSHADEATKSELGDYERIGVRPVPIQGADLTSDHEACGKLSNGEDLLARARRAWDDALAGGEAHGFRNAQATVLAPTGTIGLLMDCDTTGVEPDFALVKFKKLAGGGYFKIVNQSLPPALKSLGYGEAQVNAILQHVLGTLHLDVPLTLDGKTDSTRSFREWLTERGFTAEDLEKVEAGLPSVFELGMAFSAWTLGDEALARVGLDPAAAQQAGFSVLEQLGLRRKDVAAMNAIVCGTQTVEGAPQLKDEHLAVFDCANTCGPTGERFISAEGHIRMMAAAQPFLSGAISKTINLPHDASVADIQDAYRTSWELGIKANALYRDGCKLSQPLNTSSSDVQEDADDDADVQEALEEVAAGVAAAAGAAVAGADGEAVGGIVERVVERPLRRRLPDTRLSRTHKFNVAGNEGYLTVGLHDDGSPGELFITMAKEGSTIGGLMDTLGTAVSVALQYGVPIESLVTKFSHQRFEPAGMTHNPDIPFAKSLVDYIFRWMGIEFVEGYREQVVPRRAAAVAAPTPPAQHPGAAVVGRAAAAPRNPRTAGGHAAEPARSADSTLSEAMSSLQSDAPACDGCGSITVRNGTCYRCLNCGASMGCS
ncbi:adenosylcobalamin-dependent ribonucleoside-diphosphate reductase [Phycisphaera mikurensis]|uniref:Vitamin B12-dependent ribonucleotide reductase n=1 Tax=Phycisphaera mikurensis (strain NBRC 102666 / KCTC 22515 / FYK2301M01) TaxID=1142394 RepID=I0IB15_PHYMF|nr:adenosylcobalamin-dependent ribonucleoside-diphosphate reductase [Phycisphaera mikurensis]MBB6442576.1 ribonucleoside-diphosphate reductase alpha chain [Phycisphaera mikurensis]BAM02453.1 vitamin B12-dependent ribonucleotide reductase [Phycisphaera mikurensis NBRC 102666]